MALMDGFGGGLPAAWGNDELGFDHHGLLPGDEFQNLFSEFGGIGVFRTAEKEDPGEGFMREFDEFDLRLDQLGGRGIGVKGNVFADFSQGFAGGFGGPFER